MVFQIQWEQHSKCETKKFTDIHPVLALHQFVSCLLASMTLANVHHFLIVLSHFQFNALQLAAFYYPTPLSLMGISFSTPFWFTHTFLGTQSGCKKGWVYSLPRMITSEKGTGNCITSLFIGLCNAMLKNCHPNTYKFWGSWGDDVRQGVLTKPIHRKLGNIEQLHEKDYSPHGCNAVA